MRCENCEWACKTGVTKLMEAPEPTSILMSFIVDPNWQEVDDAKYNNMLANSVYCYRFPKYEIMPKDRFCSAYIATTDGGGTDEQI